MKQKVLQIGSYILVAALASALTLAGMGGTGETSKLSQLQSLIEERYIEGADPTVLEDAAADAMVAATGDRWSYYIPACEYETYQENMANAYVGVGITILSSEEVEGFRIMSVTPDGPAEEAGVQKDDVLIGVDGQDVRQSDANQVRNLVRGEEGTDVVLTVLREEAELELTVQRRHMETPVATYTMLENQVGLVTIENFDSRCSEETIAAIEALREEGAQKLIFDVRNNPGGFAEELVKVLDYLLPEGDLFRTERYDGYEDVDVSDENFLDMPMAVLVNGDSYSAAEFFAAALQEYEAAIVVGEHTSGKGHFQTTYQLSDGSAVALSIGRYYTPKGVCLEGVGIEPDVPVTVDEDTAMEIYFDSLPWKEDPQIQAALDALK
ncbi:MAG TPA: PDZ domain-containing protein [Candidatus Faecousia faecavium]|nr:PDZ domain-containing protein [Candidatus Faecousia faecavium]